MIFVYSVEIMGEIIDQSCFFFDLGKFPKTDISIIYIYTHTHTNTHTHTQTHTYTGIAVTVSTVIGSGIFSSPGNLLRYAGKPIYALAIWLITGVFCYIGGMCYAELG